MTAPTGVERVSPMIEAPDPLGTVTRDEYLPFRLDP